MKNRACSRCGEAKPEGEFYFNRRNNRPVSWCRDCFLRTMKEYRTDLRSRAVDRLGGACKSCGIRDARVLCFDHIDGLKGRKRESQDMVLRQVLAGSTAYQLLCHNCNHLKRFENHEFALRAVR